MNPLRSAMHAAITLAMTVALQSCTGSPDADWPTYGGAGENHWSPLTQVDTNSVGQLGLEWHYDIATPGSSVTAPVQAGGILYFASGLSQVHALDAVTGKLLWQYDPKVPEHAGFELRGAWGSRGMAYANGKVFVGTMDGRLIALDAKSGRLAWSAQTTGRNDGRYITGAPWVFGNKVVIGHGGGDFAPVRGYVTAYDQDTGKQAWRFYTVPGDPSKGFENKAMEMAAKTWKGEWWKLGGGGTVWNAMAYDPKYNRIYLGVGNGGPWNQKIRSPGGGDNLFLSSIVALDADSGEYVWHYQTNPGETWDYNASMDMNLATLEIGGKPRDVLMTAPKNGYFYVLDRKDGKFISAGQIAYQNWNKGFDANGRPIENPAARYPDGKPWLMFPSMNGAHGPEAMSFSPQTGLAYIPTKNNGAVYIDPPNIKTWAHQPNMQANGGVGAPPPGMVPPPPESELQAWDPVRQKAVWKLPLKGGFAAGGTMATAGNLVFFGTIEGRFLALDARTGKQLWSFDGQEAISAQPISYSVKGKQYVTVITGGRFLATYYLARAPEYRLQARRVLTFALGGKDALPARTAELPPYQDDPAFRIDPARAAQGAMVFGIRCGVCHGFNAMAAGTAPNLLRSPVPLDRATFDQVVRQGALKANGMPDYPELSDTEIDALQTYIRQRAREVQAAEKAAASTGRK